MSRTSVGKVARGAAWMVAARMADRLVGVVSTVILARVLTPADFGLVAMAMAVIGLIELASAFGFEVPLLRAPHPSRGMYDTVWTLNLLFGVGCAAATAIAAFPAAAFYNDERLVPIMLILASAWALGSTANVGTVDFRRQLDFAKEFKFLMATRVVTFSITIPSALIFRSFWALIAGMVAGRVTNVMLSYWWHPYRPRFSLEEMRALFSFSFWIFVEKVASFGNTRAADFVLGRTHGAFELGVYRLADEIGYLPGSELVGPVNRALLPGASRLVESGRSMVEVLKTTTGILVLVVIPACVGIAAVADPLVRGLLGQKWLAAIPIVEIMAIYALMVALWANQQNALLAAGLSKLPGLVAVVRLTVFVPLLLVLTPAHGAWGVALSSLVSAACALGIGLQISPRRLSFPFTAYVGVVWRPSVAAFTMFLIVRELLSSLDPPASSFGAIQVLGMASAAGVVVYVVVLTLLFLAAGRPAGAEKLLVKLVRQRWGK